MSKKTTKSKTRSTPKRARIDHEDIIQMILEDHKPLKKLIKIMKNSDLSLEEREDAFDQFAPLLVSHAKPEEQTLYVAMKDDDEMRSESFEGEVEHGLADQMLEEIKRTEDEDLWTARVKVLAELVEHHIEEEEEDLLPDYRKRSDPADRREWGLVFLQKKMEIQAQGSNDAPPERFIEQPMAH